MPGGRVSRDRERPTLDFFERFGCGCILVDGSGRILEANEYAGRYIGRDLGVRNGRLIATDAACNEDLQRCITEFLTDISRPDPHAQAIALRLMNEHQLIVHMEPVDGPAPGSHADAKGLIRIIDLDDAVEAPLPDLLQAAFHLTLAEAKVAQRIACGDSPEQIAALHQVSSGTIREQLKAVFHKTGTHRQSQLVALLARLGRLSR